MNDTAPDPPATRRLRWPVAVAVGAITLFGVAWLERRPLVRHFVDATLARDHVPVRYTIADVGPGVQRLTDVVIGDPAHPDLVADWIETEVGYDITGPRLAGVRAGHVMVRARLVGGRLTFGAIDRLLPAGGGPRGLPALMVDIAEARISVGTAGGAIAVTLAGKGRLDGGFQGTVAAVADRLDEAGCIAVSPTAAGRLAVANGQPQFVGPVRARNLQCGKLSVDDPVLEANAALGRALDRWRGTARLATGTSSVGDLRWSTGGAVAIFDGTGGGTTGRVAVAAQGLALPGDSGRARRLTASGGFAIGPTPRFDGQLGVEQVELSSHMLAPLATVRTAGAGTPIGPLLRQAGTALIDVGRGLDGRAHVTIVRQAGVTAMTIDTARLTSRTGAAVRFDGAVSTAGDIRATIATAGGGLPTVSARVARGAVGAPIGGTATMLPYAAGGAILTLAPVSFAVARSGAWSMTSAAAITGPLGVDGRIERLTVPLAIRRDPSGAVLADEECVPVSAASLTAGTLRIGATRLLVCPQDRAMLRLASAGGVAGGMRIGTTHLVGQLGASPLRLAIGSAGATFASRSFAVRALSVALGDPARPTHVDIDTLTGSLGDGGLHGAFTNGGGRIGAVPLVLSDASGDWRFADDALGLAGALTVADAGNPAARCTPPFGSDAPRFCPLEARTVRLTLVRGRIDATGALYAPGTGVRVADVALRHTLATGAGHAGFAVPGIVFTKEFQPDRLTPASFGVVADVRGGVSGDAAIDWGGNGVTSQGRFTTDGLDLAAAFGPVTGISGTIAFDDLLALATPAGQVLKVAGIDPGVAVNDGTVTYRLRPGSIVDVAGGRWPFAGGTLTLEPTTLDLAHPVAKRLTFRVDGMQAARFLQQFDFKNLDATGTFDGVLPMVFDEAGGRIEKGRLAVRPGGGTIAYVGDLTEKDLGFWGNLAFQALKSLRYRSLDIAMDGPLAGEMVTGVRFAGVQQGKGAQANFLVRRLERLPFVFDITIRAPFRGLIDSAQSFYDPRRLVDRMLPAKPAVQPAASAPTP